MSEKQKRPGDLYVGETGKLYALVLAPADSDLRGKWWLAPLRQEPSDTFVTRNGTHLTANDAIDGAGVVPLNASRAGEGSDIR